MDNKYFILDKEIILDDNYDIYMRQGVKYFITRTVYNQLKIEKGCKNISKFMWRKNISLVGYVHDSINDDYIINDLNVLNKDTYLYVYSNDISIIEKLNSISMDHYHIQKLQNEISNRKSITNNVLSLIFSWLKEIILIIIKGVGIAVIFFIAIFILFFYPCIINNTVIKILLVILTIPIIVGLFILYRREKCIYGIIEIIFGLVTIASIIFNPTENTTTGIIDVLKMLGGIYITIRGLNDFENGLKSPRYIEVWGRLFKRKNKKR